LNPFHRQLLTRFLRTVAVALAVLLSVLALFGLAVAMDQDADGGSGADLTTAIVLRTLTSALTMALPLSLLLGTLFTVGDLARYQELTALAAGGWSTLQVMRPLIVVALAATVLVTVLQLAGWSNPPGDVGARTAGAVPTGAAPTLEAQTARHARNAYPLLCLLVVLTAIPLAATRRRVSVYSGFGMAFALIVAYNIVTATAQSLGRHGGLPPLVAGWTGPVALAACARWLWIKEKL